MSDYKILLCEQCAGLKAELSQADFDRKAWKADCLRTQAALDLIAADERDFMELIEDERRKGNILQAVVDRLKHDLKVETAIAGTRYRSIIMLEADAVTLRAEVERLRAALRGLFEWGVKHDPTDLDPWMIARAALSPQEGTP